MLGKYTQIPVPLAVAARLVLAKRLARPISTSLTASYARRGSVEILELVYEA